jgi:hypothetical protein
MTGFPSLQGLIGREIARRAETKQAVVRYRPRPRRRGQGGGGKSSKSERIYYHPEAVEPPMRHAARPDVATEDDASEAARLGDDAVARAPERIARLRDR